LIIIHKLLDPEFIRVLIADKIRLAGGGSRLSLLRNSDPVLTAIPAGNERRDGRSPDFAGHRRQPPSRSGQLQWFVADG